MFWALSMASRLGKTNLETYLKPAKQTLKQVSMFQFIQKNVILSFLVFLVIRSTDLP